MTKLNDALQGVSKLGLDTSPLIYFVERHPTYLSQMREIISRIDAGAFMGYSSVITLTEVLTQPLRLANGSLVSEYRMLLRQGRNFTLVSVDASVCETAAELRARYNLRTPDALQVASALSMGCEALLTNDTGIRRVTELHVLLLDDLEL